MKRPSPALKYWPKSTRPTKPDLPPLLVNEAGAAMILGLSARTVFTLADTGQLQARYIGRRKLFRFSDLEAFAAGLPCEPHSLRSDDGKEESR